MTSALAKEPVEISSYRRRLVGISWIAGSVLATVAALIGHIDWTLGIVFGLSLGLLNFFLLCRQTAKLAQAADVTEQKGKSFMVLGHWTRYIVMGAVIYLIYQKHSVSFPAFLAGLALVYVIIFIDGMRFQKRAAS